MEQHLVYKSYKVLFHIYELSSFGQILSYEIKHGRLTRTNCRASNVTSAYELWTFNIRNRVKAESIK